jgi:hypothetical protein
MLGLPPEKGCNVSHGRSWAFLQGVEMQGARRATIAGYSFGEQIAPPADAGAGDEQAVVCVRV